MVQSGATFTIKDAPIVQLELTLVCLNGHRHWLMGHRLHEMVNSQSGSKESG